MNGTTALRGAYRAARVTALRRLGRGGQPSPGVRILGYHRIVDADGDSLAVPPARFRAQMQRLARGDVRPVGLAEAVRRLRTPIHEPLVCVTFDDGYHDNLDHAFPVLHELGIPATIFVATRIIDGDEPFGWYAQPPAALSWDEIRAMADGGLVEFGAHTLTHPLLPQVDDDRAHAEIVGSRAELAERIRRPVETFCYPAGRYTQRDVELVEHAGYLGAVTSRPGLNAGDGSPFVLRRTFVGADVGARVFDAILDGLLDAPDPLPALLRRARILGG